MYYVYIIKSLTDPNQIYIGYTSNLKYRLIFHNTGKSIHTAKFYPWELIMYSAFKDQAKAIEFEQYLKSGSGNVFVKKRLV